jgi:hypothetical protein
MLTPTELRVQSRIYRNAAVDESTHTLRLYLARHALALAQLAERLERTRRAPRPPDPNDA